MVTVLQLQPVFLSIAPVSVAVMLYAMKSKKLWLMRFSLIGMVISVFLLFAFQYLDYRYLENCLLQGEVYNPLLSSCIKLN
ncbi:hypothetical protein C9I99_01330 [Photobacterium lutimaris]|uniref:Uncharacterized protein n=1 Tax=Photobacterium lutimaris TaxID=388278 RepID=A0A2T3J319_9GAMM|nr:hypothetical protein C9I99_01330 [Photobacterium lutimaris]TDR78750.1 hypothetical protein DFP78_101263 [Photobacterium lutimaris]